MSEEDEGGIGDVEEVASDGCFVLSSSTTVIAVDELGLAGGTISSRAMAVSLSVIIDLTSGRRVTCRRMLNRPTEQCVQSAEAAAWLVFTCQYQYVKTVSLKID